LEGATQVDVLPGLFAFAVQALQQAFRAVAADSVAIALAAKCVTLVEHVLQWEFASTGTHALTHTHTHTYIQTYIYNRVHGSPAAKVTMGTCPRACVCVCVDASMLCTVVLRPDGWVHGSADARAFAGSFPRETEDDRPAGTVAPVAFRPPASWRDLLTAHDLPSVFLDAVRACVQVNPPTPPSLQPIHPPTQKPSGPHS
jgi:hypothetical protein